MGIPANWFVEAARLLGVTQAMAAENVAHRPEEEAKLPAANAAHLSCNAARMPTHREEDPKDTNPEEGKKDEITPDDDRKMPAVKRAQRGSGLVAFSFKEFLFSSFSLPCGSYFPCSCSCRKTRKHDSEHVPPIPAPAEAQMGANLCYAVGCSSVPEDRSYCVATLSQDKSPTTVASWCFPARGSCVRSAATNFHLQCCIYSRRSRPSLQLPVQPGGMC